MILLLDVLKELPDEALSVAWILDWIFAKGGWLVLLRIGGIGAAIAVIRGLLGPHYDTVHRN